MQHQADGDPTTFWNELYAGPRPIWSGEPNRVLAEVAGGLTPGRALDIGCGEGGDAVWLARNGWRVVGIDISDTAIERGRQAAAAAGLSFDQCDLRVQDLATGLDAADGGYDLVTASFFQSPVELPRAQVLRQAAALVAPDGHLLLTSHAGPPSWASAVEGAAVEGSQHRAGPGHFIAPEQEVADLALDPSSWMMVVAQTRTRSVTSPTGESGEIDDAVVLMRRRREE